MYLSPALEKKYTNEQLSAREAQRQAEFIAWGPVVFHVSRLMLKTGILAAIRDSADGLTQKELCQRTGLSVYAMKCLLEASLSIGTVLVDTQSERYTLSKTGWFLLNDPATRVNIDFVNDVNYEGMVHMEESLRNGRPEGLRHFGSWSTIYEGLSELPSEAQRSWLAFDHFYSDSAFPEALPIIFDQNRRVRTLYDVGGNTGRWALECVNYNAEVKVTVLDLPQQIAMMQQNISGKAGSERICGYGVDLLDAQACFPKCEDGPDAIWMSQFLDCFSPEQIVSILQKAKDVMTSDSRLYIMETLWDRQRFEPATLCLTMTSLYFTVMANGNSKMYNTEDLARCVAEAGLQIDHIHDHLGQGHSVVVVSLK